MVRTWLLKLIEAVTIRPSVFWMNFDKEIWADLKQRYDRGDTYRLSDVLETFYAKKQGNMTIDEYYTHLKILWDEVIMLRPILVCICTPEPPCV